LPQPPAHLTHRLPELVEAAQVEADDHQLDRLAVHVLLVVQPVAGAAVALRGAAEAAHQGAQRLLPFLIRERLALVVLHRQVDRRLPATRRQLLGDSGGRAVRLLLALLPGMDCETAGY